MHPMEPADLMLSIVGSDQTPARMTNVIGHQFINSQLIADQFAANGYFVVMVFLPAPDSYRASKARAYSLTSSTAIPFL